ncbi:unnamed protein product [Chilo suppressalis]|uniref:Laminin G domain-containing protein n=1 Tax=Chilo suppressalis TaxID=168631 RepID=A0ABN8B1Y6_CHISP|nr:unnamed protein product [Chilo suppressalis]
MFKSTVLANVILLVTVNHGLKPNGKRQQSVWRLECEMGVISDSDCPVDGGWSPWEAWSLCRGPCDDIGHRRRRRICNNPPPSLDGMPCAGLSEQIEACYLTNCTVEDFRKLVQGDPVRVESLRQLELVPALMEQCLQMECPFQGIEAALAIDNTWQMNAETLWNAIQCVKHNLGCPMIGEWGAWGSWSVCGARCGRGLRWRLRRCDNPPPSDAHLVCLGTPLQTQDCEGDQCASDQFDSFEKESGLWSDWGHWSACSVNCGIGIRLRRRTCNDIHNENSLLIWGTHCRGQHDQVEACKNQECVLNGGWSGWSAWGPCSQTCGPGRRSRTRSCTRPIPAGPKSVKCVGPKTEVSPCQLSPCEVFPHTVAVLSGESHIQYNFENKRSALFHFYIRFMPLSPHGTLVRRGAVHYPLVRLSLQKWHVCVDASGSSHSCDLPRICTTEVIEPATWHSALVTVTSEAATLRLDDSDITIRSTFPCDPELPIEVMNIFIGERLHGEVQEIMLNFIPLNIKVDRERRSKLIDFSPTYVSNVAYEKANLEEAFLNLDDEQYLRLPCFNTPEAWKLRLTVKSKIDSGTILFLKDDNTNNWLYLAIQNLRLKLKLNTNDFRAETSSSCDIPLDQWLDIQISIEKGTNTIEACINSGEHLHILFGDDKNRKRRKSTNEHHKSDIKSAPLDISRAHKNTIYRLCNDEFFVGGIPREIKKNIPEDLTPFSGVIASLSIDGILQDLHRSNVERYKEEKVQVSSRTASVSGSYHETAWGNSNTLNLTCLHARSLRSPHSAHWLFLDIAVNSVLKDKKIRSLDDGRVLRLVATADNDLRGFYTCRSHSNKRTRNIVTYGVLGKIQYNLSEPDLTTIFAVFTTVCLVIGTILWLVIEGIHDIRDGYGFFRDAHLSQEEEAESVCKFIDANLHLIGCKTEAKMAKARARRKAEQLASKSSFAAQEPQGLLQEQNCSPENCDGTTTASEPEGLPALPEVKSSRTMSSHNIYRCEPCYISSPQHGSDISTRSKFTSSIETSSPRYLCSQLLLAKRVRSAKRSVLFNKKSKGQYAILPRKARSKLLTIKPSRCINLSPAQRILQKFEQLKSDDTIE